MPNAKPAWRCLADPVHAGLVAVLTAAGVSSQIPHNVARGRHQMLVSALCALAVGLGALVINTFFTTGAAAG